MPAGLAGPPLAGRFSSRLGRRPLVVAGLVTLAAALGLSLGIATMGALLSSGTTDVLRTTATTRETFVDGLSAGLALNAGIALVAAAIALHTLRPPRWWAWPASATPRGGTAHVAAGDMDRPTHATLTETETRPDEQHGPCQPGR